MARGIVCDPYFSMRLGEMRRGVSLLAYIVVKKRGRIVVWIDRTDHSSVIF